VRPRRQGLGLLRGPSTSPLDGDAMGTTLSKHTVCCSSPASICYWFMASVIAWGLLSLVGLYWRPLGRASGSTILLAAGIGCVANWRKNRTFHCGITAPLLLIAGTVFLLSDEGIFSVPPWIVWALVGGGTCVAFLLEWRHTMASASPSNNRWRGP
jgi:hypothetical protein